MPRFYFDVRDGDDFTPDEEGLDFPGTHQARVEASRALGPEVHRVQGNGRTMRLIPDSERYSTFDVTQDHFLANVLGKAVFKVNVMSWSLVPDQLRI